MQKTTLVSFVGTGISTNNNGYSLSEYVIDINGSKKILKEREIVLALIKSLKWTFNEIYLVGTRTSAWDEFFYDLKELDEDSSPFYELLFSKRSTGVSDEDVKKLENILTKQYGIPFKISVHDAKIDHDTTLEISNSYIKILSEIAKNNSNDRLMVDITHGFRSMPFYFSKI